jgi:hypothetical protein
MSKHFADLTLAALNQAVVVHATFHIPQQFAAYRGTAPTPVKSLIAVSTIQCFN